jgi:hypothetical protein
MERPFRFGVTGESIRASAELTNTARRAEGLGYSILLLRDHFVAEPFGHQFAPLVALAAAAAATTTLRIGTATGSSERNDLRGSVRTDCCRDSAEGGLDPRRRRGPLR